MVKLNQLSTLLCGVSGNFCKLVISPQFNLSLRGPNEFNRPRPNPGRREKFKLMKIKI